MQRSPATSRREHVRTLPHFWRARVVAARRSLSGAHGHQQRAPGQHGAGGRHHCAFCSAPRRGVHDDSQREVAEEHPRDDTERPLPPRGSTDERGRHDDIEHHRDGAPDTQPVREHLMLSAPHESAYGSPCRCSDLHDGDRTEDDGGQDCGCNGHDGEYRSAGVNGSQIMLRQPFDGLRQCPLIGTRGYSGRAPRKPPVRSHVSDLMPSVQQFWCQISDTCTTLAHRCRTCGGSRPQSCRCSAHPPHMR